MKFIFILLLLLLLDISCINILGKDEEITINDGLQSGMVVVKLDNFTNAEKVYLSLEIDKGDIEATIIVKFSDTLDLSPYNFTYNILRYSTTETPFSKTYYYKINYEKYNYMIFKYSFLTYYTFPNYLKVKATDKDPTRKITLIILIVAGCIAVIAITVTIIVLVIRRKKRKNKDVNTDGVSNVINPSLSVASQEPFVNNNNNYNYNNNYNSNYNYNYNQQYYPQYPQSN